MGLDSEDGLDRGGGRLRAIKSVSAVFSIQILLLSYRVERSGWEEDGEGLRRNVERLT